MKVNCFTILVLCLSSSYFFSCQTSIPTEIKQELANLPDKMDYNFHVKPILSEHCFSCHGPDEKKRQANLRLDQATIAYQQLTPSGKIPIVPNKLAQSEVFHQIISEDAAYQMPPPEAKSPLSNRQKAILIKWIEQGAVYQPHWAFVNQAPPAVPALSGDWGKNEIDKFVLNRLSQTTLKPSNRATKETLVRRIAFDLTGLPPTLGQIDAFLADNSAQAYEKILDQFLASPAYGERMAAYWMDVARYADSDGYLDDKHREVSPYRDWVIEAFNENMPYDKFVTLQVAGDLLPNASKEEILPTAFNRLHKKNSEAGIDLEEFRVEYVADKVNTFGKAFLGLTVECARCHTHKYDPISHEDYYSLFAFYNQTDEIGHAVYGPDITPGPALLLTDEAIDKQLAFINQKIKAQEADVSKQQRQFIEEKDNHFLSAFDKQVIETQLQEKLTDYYPFDEKVKSKGEREFSPNKLSRKRPAKLGESILEKGIKGNALFNTDYSAAFLGDKVGWFDRMDAFSIDFWVYPDRIYEEASVFLHCEDWRLGYKGYSLHLEDNELVFIMARAHPQNAIQVRTVEALPSKKWTHLTITYDGSSRAEGVKLYISGKAANTKIDIDNLYKGILFEPNIHTYGFGGFQLGKRDGIQTMNGGGIDELRFFNQKLSALEVLYLQAENALDPILATPNLYAELIQEWQLNQEKALLAQQDSLTRSRQRLNLLMNEVPEIMVMKDLKTPRPTFVLDRGDFDSPSQAVNPRTPPSILAFPANFPKNRLGLAQWLFHKDNPLTARVMVNRIWQMHFGKGLVTTQEDFGNQGALPTHPELLDWLANWFIKSGWDMKALHRLIINSTTYQQSGVISQAALDIDPENKFLARGARFRLSAEMIRDNAIAISGLLVRKVGGKSVYPYQPAGLWDEISTKHWRYKYLQTPGEGLYRRSLYTVWKRTSPPPSMLLFDANDRSTCTVQRKRTNTPLQALVLLNDPQFVEAARVLAENTIGQTKELNQQIEIVFRQTTGRFPDEKEITTLLKLYHTEIQHFEENTKATIGYLSVGEIPYNRRLAPERTAALAVIANALMNTDEGFTRK